MRTLPLENNLISHAVYKRKHKTCIVTQLFSCSAFQMMHSISQSHTHTHASTNALQSPCLFGTALHCGGSCHQLVSLDNSLSHKSVTGWQIDRQTYEKPARHAARKRRSGRESEAERGVGESGRQGERQKWRQKWFKVINREDKTKASREEEKSSNEHRLSKIALFLQKYTCLC